VQIKGLVKQLRDLVSVRKTSRAKKRQLTQMNAMEQLETRLLLTADVWTGASSNLWSDDGNWQDGTAPTTGEDLIFPASATNMTSVYDSGLGVSTFGSIDIQSSGYDISTSFSSSLVLASGLSATYGSSISNFDISFDPGNGMVAVGAGATLEVGGGISGSSGLEVSGGGTLQTAGTSSNTYSGTTTVDAATTLVLDKSSATAVPGNLTINGTGTVQLAQSDQISDSTNVTMLAGAMLDLNNFDDSIGGLNLTGSTVSTGTGTITLGGDVASNSDATTSVISGNMDLGGATRTFTVGNNPSLDPDLSITANISGIGAGIISAGPNSQLLLSGNNTYDGTTTITAGAIEIASDNALGASSAGTIVNSGFSLALLGGITVPEPITINGVGFGGLGAIFNGNGNNAINGAITLGANSTIGSLSGTLTFNGAISDGPSSFALTKVYTGTVAFTNANNYDGGTAISSGVIAISNGSALGTGAVSISSGAELDLSNNITLSRDISFRGAGANSNGALRSVSGNNTYSGTATLQATGTWINVDAGQLTLSGDLTDTSNGYTTEKYGSGLLLVTGNLTSVGQLHSVEGEVRIDGSYAGAVILAGGKISGTGSPGSIDHSDGDLGTVDPGTGAGTVGTLTTTNGYAVRTNATTHIDIGGTTAGSTYDQIVAVPGGVILTGSNIEVSLVNGFVPAISDVFTIIDDQAGDTITGTFSGLNEGATFQTGNVTFQISYTGGTGNDVTLTVVAVTITWTGLGADGLWSTAANWDTNVAPAGGEDLIFPQGAARLSNINDFAGQSFHSIEIHGSGYSIIGNPITLTNGISAAYTSGTSEFNIDTTMTASETFDVADGGTLDISGMITVNNFGGGYGVTKTGGGTLRYSGSSANQYNGGTVINAGTLVLAKSDDVISSNGFVIVGDNTNGATLQVEGNNQFWVGADVTVNEGSTFDVGSYSQFISNLNLQGSTVQIDDAGVLSTFVGVNTYSTSNNIMSVIQGLGALKIDNSSNTFTIADDAELGVELSISTIIQGQLLNSGLSINGPGTVAISGNNTFGGDVTVNSGAILVEGNNALGTTAGVTMVASGASVFFSGSGLSVAENFNIEGVGLTALGALGVLSGSNTLTGSVDMTNNGQIGAADGATLTIDGVIDDGASTYNLEIINGSTGRTVLAGSNLFGGDVVVSSGFVRGTNDNSFGDAASSTSLNVQSGATLELAGGITIPGTKTIEISGLPVANSSKIQSVTGDNAIVGDIGITGGNNVAFDVASGTSLTVFGGISGSLDFDKNNTGTLIISGTNTNTGNVNVGDGTMIVNGSLATANSVFVDGVLRGAGTLPAVTISSIGSLAPGSSPGILSTGDLYFSDSGSTYSVELDGTTIGTQYDQTDVTGTVILAGATLSISLGYGLGIGDSFTIIDNDGVDAISGTFNGLAEGSTITIGATTLTISYVGGDGNDVVLNATDVSYTWDGGDADDSLWSSPDNWVGDVTPASGSNLIFANGASRLANTNDFAANSDFFNITIASNGYNISGNSIDLNGSIAAIYNTGSSSFGPGIALQGSQTIDVATGGNLDLIGSISGSADLTKAGVGTLVLYGINSYTGVTFVDEGTLLLSSAGVSLPGNATVSGPGAAATIRELQGNQIADSATVTLANAGATLDLNGFDDTIGSLSLTGSTVTTSAGLLTIASGGDITTIASSQTATISGHLSFGGPNNYFTVASGTTSSGLDLSVSAIISGGINIIKSGVGTMALSGANTYSGGTNINSGVLAISTDTGAGTGVVNILGTGTFDVSGDVSVSNSLNVFSSGTAISSSAGTNTLSGSINLGSDSVIDVGTSSSLEISSVIDDSGHGNSLTKSGPGTLFLSNSNTYSGSTTAASGFLLATNSNAFGNAVASSSIFIQDGATLQLEGGITLPSSRIFDISGLPVAGSSKIMNISGDNAIQGDIGITGGNNESIDVASGTTLTVSGIISGSLDIDKNGTGTLVLSGTNTNTGNVNVGNGTLLVNGSLATSNSVFVDGTLGGSGTVSGVTLSNIGTLSPGNSPGIMNTGDLTFQSSGSTFSVEINGTSVGTQYDQTNVTGTVSLAGATLSISRGYSPTGGDTFVIINNDGSDAVSGTFNGLAEGASVSIGGKQFLMTYAGGDGNDIALSVFGIPTVLSPSATTTSQRPTIAWTSVANAAQYVVLVRNDSTGSTSLLFSQAGTSYTPTKDLGIGSYRVYVRAVTAGGVSSQYSTSSSFRITTAVVLNVPTKFQTTTTPTISWTPVGGAVKYDLWINNLSTGVPQVVRDVNVTGSSWTSQTSLPMGSYRAWVRGIDASGLVASWSTAVDFFLLPAVSVVGPVTPTFDRTPTFTWDAVPGAVSYDLYYRNHTTGSVTTSITNIVGNSYTPSSNLADGNYRWYVFAVTQGNYRSQSATLQYSYVGGRPMVLTPTGNTSDTTPTFNWTPVSGAATYKLFVSRTDVPTSGIISQVGLTTANFTPTTPLPVGTYRVWVQAVSSTGPFSLWSDPVNFRVTSIGGESPALPRELLLSDLTILSDGDLQLVANPSRSNVTEDAVPKEEASTPVEAMASISLESKSEFHYRLLLESQGILNENSQKSSATGTVIDEELLDAVMADVNSLHFLMERVA
jgi:fibronectin-binding autotransporter adhesin